MKLIDFNVNNYVWIKLTDVGRKELEKQHAELKKDFPSMPDYVPKKEDADGFSKWQMHDVMLHFGHLCLPTFNIPFETAIKIEVKE